MRIINRIIYGNTSTPHYIRSKHKWLYKNKWVNRQDVLEHYGIKATKDVRTYKYSIGKVTHTTTDFDTLLSDLISYPNSFRLEDFNLYLEDSAIIQKLYRALITDEITKITRNYNDAIKKAQEAFYVDR